MSDRNERDSQGTDNNFFSGMALIKRDGRYELVEMSEVIKDIKASHPNPLPYEYRQLLQDETPREFRFIPPHVGEEDATRKYAQSLATKATEFFAESCEIFARIGRGICAHVCSCQTRQDAQTGARIMEMLRQLVNDLSEDIRRNASSGAG